MKQKNCYDELARANELTYKVIRNCDLIPGNRNLYKPLLDMCKEGQILIAAILNQYSNILTLWMENTQYYLEIANYNSILEGCVLVVDLFNNLNSFSRIMQYSKYENSISEILEKLNVALKAIEKVPINKVNQNSARKVSKFGRHPAIDINNGALRYSNSTPKLSRRITSNKTLPEIPDEKPTAVHAIESEDAYGTKYHNTALSRSPPGTALSFDEEYLVDEMANHKGKEMAIRKTDSVMYGNRHIPSLIEDYSFNNTKVSDSNLKPIPTIEFDEEASLPLIIEDSIFDNQNMSDTLDLSLYKEDEVSQIKIANPEEADSISTKLLNLDLDLIEKKMLEEPDSLNNSKINRLTVEYPSPPIYETQILELSLANYVGKTTTTDENPDVLLEEALKLHSQSTPESRVKAFDKFQYIHNQYKLNQATYFLGYYYYWGYGVAKDREKAINFFIEASNLGSSDATDHLGIHYTLNGNHIKAYEYYYLASKENNPKALYHLYECFLHGLGIQKSISEAMAYLKKAAKTGHPKACKKFENYLKEQLTNEVK